MSLIYLKFGPGYEASGVERSMPSRYKGDEGFEWEVPSGEKDDLKYELTSDEEE